jgi:hypothetical protein
MSEDGKILPDGSRPATLHNGAVSIDWPTLRDAVMAWHRLRPEQARAATIRVIGGTLYTAAEIPKLQMLGYQGDEIAEDGFTCSFRQLMLLGQGPCKMLERHRTAGFGCSGWCLCFAWQRALQDV